MRYIRFTGGNGYCGCDFDEFEVFDDNTSDVIISLRADELASDYGDNYFHIAFNWRDEYTEEDEEEYYTEECWCDWEEITEEEYKELTE